MPVFDVFVLILMLGGMSAGAVKIALSIKKRVDKAKRRKQGAHNANLAMVDEDTCHVCEGREGPIKPEIDLFINRCWFHKKCFNMLKKELL